MACSWLKIIVARDSKEVIRRKSPDLLAKIHRIADQLPNASDELQGYLALALLFSLQGK
jgi:hypothetical protein